MYHISYQYLQILVTGIRYSYAGLMITFTLGLTKCLIILSFDQTSFRFKRTYTVGIVVAIFSRTVRCAPFSVASTIAYAFQKPLKLDARRFCIPSMNAGLKFRIP